MASGPQTSWPWVSATICFAPTLRSDFASKPSGALDPKITFSHLWTTNKSVAFLLIAELEVRPLQYRVPPESDYFPTSSDQT